ncbi:hypothetical protein LZC95_33635 [Pendulispora brunnea]|uniref:Uncharacterized protein n=1 Tax=Pendulispora brunnea TaxID=2905690 RepID=A0ABZ2K4W3_9BACT
MRASFDRIARHTRTSEAPPETETERFWYGVAQPFLGMRVLWEQPLLRKRAIAPALLVLAAAAVMVMLKRDPTPQHLIFRYYATIVGLASLPSVLFANTYERLAADTMSVFGFGEGEPLLSRLHSRIVRMVQAAILVALGAAPFLFVLRQVPLTGDVFAFIASGAWSVHWIVVEAFDGARVVDPTEGETRLPWFAAWTAFPIWESTPALLRRIVHKFGKVLTRLSKPWGEEIALVARHPGLAVGFGLATAALLAVPIANLFLRPAVLVGAVHVRGRLASASGALQRQK